MESRLIRPEKNHAFDFHHTFFHLTGNSINPQSVFFSYEAASVVHRGLTNSIRRVCDTLLWALSQIYTSQHRYNNTVWKGLKWAFRNYEFRWTKRTKLQDSIQKCTQEKQYFLRHKKQVPLHFKCIGIIQRIWSDREHILLSTLSTSTLR